MNHIEYITSLDRYYWFYELKKLLIVPDSSLNLDYATFLNISKSEKLTALEYYNNNEVIDSELKTSLDNALFNAVEKGRLGEFTAIIGAFTNIDFYMQAFLDMAASYNDENMLTYILQSDDTSKYRSNLDYKQAFEIALDGKNGKKNNSMKLLFSFVKDNKEIYHHQTCNCAITVNQIDILSIVLASYTPNNMQTVGMLETAVMEQNMSAIDIVYPLINNDHEFTAQDLMTLISKWLKQHLTTNTIKINTLEKLLPLIDINHENGILLRTATSTGNLKIVDFLLTSPQLVQHADININNNFALYNAVLSTHKDVVDYLLTSPKLTDHAIITDDVFKASVKAYLYDQKKEAMELCHSLIFKYSYKGNSEIQQFLQQQTVQKPASKDFLLTVIDWIDIVNLKDELQNELPIGKAQKKQVKI